MTKNISNVLSEIWLFVNDSWLCEVIILNLHKKCVFLLLLQTNAVLLSDLVENNCFSCYFTCYSGFPF